MRGGVTTSPRQDGNDRDVGGRSPEDDAEGASTVAICIPTFNQAQYVVTAIRSALHQDYRGTVEVWVSDDASTDATPALLEKLALEEPRLRVMRSERNLGIAMNTSRLMRAPRTDYIVRLDSDDALEQGFVSVLARELDRHPSAGYAHSAILEIGADDRQRRVRRVNRATGLQPAEAALRASRTGYRTAANVLMFRRRALEELSYYDGRPEFVEDYDLSVRMADAGFDNVYVDVPLARYRVWEDAAGMRARRKALQLEGFLRIFDESMEPAWRRRGWNLRELRRQRKRLASQHCASCFASRYRPEERARLVSLLRQLGGGPALETRIALCRLGLTPLVQLWSRLPFRARELAKNAIRLLRQVGARPRANQ